MVSNHTFSSQKDIHVHEKIEIGRSYRVKPSCFIRRNSTAPWSSSLFVVSGICCLSLVSFSLAQWTLVTIHDKRHSNRPSHRWWFCLMCLICLELLLSGFLDEHAWPLVVYAVWWGLRFDRSCLPSCHQNLRHLWITQAVRRVRKF